MPWLFLFGAAFVVQAAYWRRLHRGFQIATQEEAGPAEKLLPMSVVVAARDEEANLPPLLDALARQAHPRFEVVVVDDASTDRTAAIVRARAAQDDRFRLVQVEEPEPPRKKHALTLGIAAAQHGLLAFTDADCRPPPGWLATLARHHAAHSEGAVLVGYGPFRRRPGLLNRFTRYETFVSGFLGAAGLGLGRPFMAVGRNLSYPRALFTRIGGFAHSLQSLSGDDDLLVQEVARRRAAPIHFVADSGAFVPTDAPATWGQWRRQKLRHVSAGRFYDRRVQVHLTLFHTTSIALWGAPLLAGWPGAGLLAAKLLIQAAILRPAARVLDERDLLPVQPFLELLYTLYTLLVAPLGALKAPRKW